ncbi:glycosyl transferase family 2 [Bradyrhizobium sp. CCBAU 11386]|uniref:glycosyltransferase family 2 protein n=1 Tax=Bradyrhizobium sp. CCBAU 11386 TaxID=1630837 RepID=UPI0023020613|nr:glycosyltransferase family 2 protein [Bradyrhizobium sp. CCBAU 11386]MDA9508692.1 glycosyl transferase family 2 [Bradyrhizobium sp. CCBAU 11386]
MKSAEHLVSVVIPAYNAERTIDETLRSVRSQSHCHLEIIVVDDGSVDDTIVVAERHAAQDSRIRIIRQKNEGVAAARNRGWQHACSDLIAFIDADDLWAPTKIELQLEALVSAGEQTGLVYSWYALIDEKSRVIMNGEPAYCAGDVLDYIFSGNFIGNGSAVLVRRQALLAANGFESGLRTAGAQGCEDFLFYCRVAETYQFAVVPDYLIGYRFLPENMSSNLPRMMRSWMLVIDEMILRHPDRVASLQSGLRNYGSWVLVRALTSGQLRYFAKSLYLLSQRNPTMTLKLLVCDLPRESFIVVKNKLLALRKREHRKSRLFFSIGNPG